MMGRRLLLIVLPLLFAYVAFAQEETDPPRVATTSEMALQFSRIGHSPVVESMGGAGILSTSSVAWASFYNPAVIPFYKKKVDASVSFNSWKPSSSSYLNLAGAYNLGDKIGLALGATLGMGKTMNMTDEFGSDTGHFRPIDYQVNAGLAYRFLGWGSVGINVRYIGQRLYTHFSQGTFATDIYFMGVYKGFKGTVGFDNIGGSVKDLGGRRWNIPSSVTFAAGYERTIFGEHDIEAELRGDYYFIEDRAVVNRPFCLGVGLSYSFRFISARLGYHYGAESSLIPSFGAAGMSLLYRGIRVDAMYYIAREGSPMKDNISFGLGYAF